jgi:hypothetical protein
MGVLQVLVQCWFPIAAAGTGIATAELHAQRIAADPLIRDLTLELLGMRVALVGNYPGYVRQPGCGEQDEKEVR